MRNESAIVTPRLRETKVRSFRLQPRASGADRNNLQILRCNYSEFIAAAIVFRPQRFEFVA